MKYISSYFCEIGLNCVSYNYINDKALVQLVAKAKYTQNYVIIWCH